jgi:hypothetical protein
MQSSSSFLALGGERKSGRRLRPFLLGVVAAVIGLIGAVTVEIVKTSVVDVYTALLARRIPGPQPLALEDDSALPSAGLRRGRGVAAGHGRLSRTAAFHAKRNSRFGREAPSL